LKASLLLFLFLIIQSSFCQEWELINTVLPNQEIAATSIDSKDMFYIGTSTGNLIRYDSDGKEDEYYSALNNSSVTMIQTWNRLKVFTFFQQQQSIAILDRFTTTPKTIDLRDLGLQYAWLFAPGIDNSYWALSAENKDLIKYDDQNLSILFRIILGNEIQIKNASYMRAHKNLLIIVDIVSGIWIFDQYGNFLGMIPEPGIRQIQIFEDMIHATNGSEYLQINPFTLDVLERKKAPREGAFWSVVISGDRFIFFSKNQAAIYKLH
jgi:hypothetical protein